MGAPPLRTELADTYPNPSNATFRGGIGKLWDYVTGLLGATGDADEARAALGVPALTDLNAGQLLINSNFTENAWGRSGVIALGAGNFAHERWKAGAGGCTYTISTSGGVATLNITAGSLVQVIEGTQLRTGTHILRWTGTAQGKIGGGSYGASGITANVTGGANLNIEFGIGTLSLPHFRPGTAAVPWSPYQGIYGSEEQACMRYLPRAIATFGGFEAFGHGFSTSATQVRAQVPFPVPARVIPTGISGVVDAHISANDGVNTYVNGAATIATLTSRTVGGLNLTVTGMTAFRPCSVYFNNAAGKILFTGCEL